MTRTKLFFLAEGMEFTLTAEIEDGWIGNYTWERSEFTDAQNDAIKLFITKNERDIERDFWDIIEQDRKEAEESWAERDCY
jgi:hypothetical protein